MLFGFSRIAVIFAGPLKKKTNHDTSKASLSRFAVIAAGTIPFLALISVPLKEMPHLEAEFHPFRIRTSPSMKAWQEMQHELKGRENSVPVIISGTSMGELLENTTALEKRLNTAQQSGALDRFVLPVGILPHPANQRANVSLLKNVISESERLLGEIEQEGFSEDGKALTSEVLQSWNRALQSIDQGEPFAVPQAEFAEWTVGRLFHRSEGVVAALGSVKPANPRDRDWVLQICDKNVAVASLSSLGTALNHRIKGDLKNVFLPMIGLLVLMLAIVFRSWKDWLLSLFSLTFAGCAMVILTLWTPLSWNSFNICGLPLLFGTGLDFSIHMIFALRRSGGNLQVVNQGIARALIFCGTSSAIGFGSLALASAHGLASLGQICAAGILINMVIAVWLLPQWYRLLHRCPN
jgi:predicted RND superfamily exporter protein